MFTPAVQLSVFALSALVSAAPAAAPAIGTTSVKPLTDAYAPVPTTCPNTALVRPAVGISQPEAQYIAERKPNANAGLGAWLEKRGSFNTSHLPTVAFSSSGGGYRALLETAGVIQAIDGRDSDFGTSGLYQGLTYEAGLSGGAWFLSSFAGNNWPTISFLRDNLWRPAFQDSTFLPPNLLSATGLTEYAAIAADLTAKQAAGFDVTIVDPYGRLLSYQLLEGPDGGAATRLSGLTKLSNFTGHHVPYPIITSRGVNGAAGQCVPALNATQYEFHPYEYGSWDHGVSAFAQTTFMGSAITDGKPTVPGHCTADYDNLGYILGTSSDVFNAACAVIPASNSTLPTLLEGLVAQAAHMPTFQDLFAIFRNPFFQYARSSAVKNDTELTLVDGGESGQNDPIWPFIQPARSVDVLIVTDNSADTTDNFPNGTEIRQTYLNAQAVGLTKMPFIPDVATFVAEGLNKRATFFGCNETGTEFIVYLPNVNYTFMSNEPTSKLQYSVAETDAMIANGNEIGTQNGAEGWPFCLACAVKNMDGPHLPKGCNACFEKYCFYRPGYHA